MTRPLRRSAVLVACLAATAAVLLPAAAHRTVDRVPEVWTAGERLLVVDSESGDVVVLDDGEEVERLSTPPAPISLARSEDGRTALALRGRDTDRDHVTVIDTAYDEATGEARRPFVSRTFVAQSPGGVSNGRLPELAGAIGVAEEGAGRLSLLDPAGLSGLGDATAGQLRLAAPDHYAFATGRDGAGHELLLAGHLRAGGVQVLDVASGEQLAWHDGCAGLHGAATDDTGTRALFGCGDGVLVVPVDPAGGAPRLVRYPGDERIAAFHPGGDGVVWGTSEGAQTVVQRIDTTGAVPVVERVRLAGRGGTRTALAVTTTPGGDRLLVLTHQGFLQLRDGHDGTLLREVQLGERFDLDFHEHVDRATAPDLAATDDHVHVSQPGRQRIVTVDLDRGRVTGRVQVEGMPTRMVLLGGD